MERIKTESASILERTEDELYQNDGYKFDEQESVLYVNGERKFAAGLHQ
jgi:hypothetical protein